MLSLFRMTELWKRLKKHLVSKLFAFIFCVILFNGSRTFASGLTPIDASGSVWAVFVSLSVVLLLIYATAKLVKLINRRSVSFYQSEHIEIIESFPLSQTMRLHLVRVKGNNIVYVIAENSRSIKIIDTFDGKDIPFDHKVDFSFQEILKAKWSDLSRKK